MEDRTDQQWLEALRENGSAAQTRAYTDLYHLLYRRLCGYIRQRSRTLSAMDGLHSDEIEALAEDYAQEALFTSGNGLMTTKEQENSRAGPS